MQITRLNNATDVADVALEGDSLTISAFEQSVALNLPDLQSDDKKNVVNIMLNNGSLVTGSGDFYVASVSVPARKYVEVVVGTDEDDKPITELKEERNIDETEIVLWDLSKIPTGKEIK